MSEVTAKDLRESIESFWESKPDADFFRGQLNNYLAAFDAMAEKAEAYEKLQSLDKSLSLEVALRMVRGE